MTSTSPVAQANALELATIRYTTTREAGAQALLDMLQQGISPPPAPVALVRYTQDTAAELHRDAKTTHGPRHPATIQAARLRWQTRNLPTQSR